MTRIQTIIESLAIPNVLSSLICEYDNYFEGKYEKDVYIDQYGDYIPFVSEISSSKICLELMHDNDGGYTKDIEIINSKTLELEHKYRFFGCRTPDDDTYKLKIIEVLGKYLFVLAYTKYELYIRQLHTCECNSDAGCHNKIIHLISGIEGMLKLGWYSLIKDNNKEAHTLNKAQIQFCHVLSDSSFCIATHYFKSISYDVWEIKQEDEDEFSFNIIPAEAYYKSEEMYGDRLFGKTLLNNGEITVEVSNLLITSNNIPSAETIYTTTFIPHLYNKITTKYKSLDGYIVHNIIGYGLDKVIMCFYKIRQSANNNQPNTIKIVIYDTITEDLKQIYDHTVSHWCQNDDNDIVNISPLTDSRILITRHAKPMIVYDPITDKSNLVKVNGHAFNTTPLLNGKVLITTFTYISEDSDRAYKVQLWN